MSLNAGAAARADDGGVPGAGRQLEAVTRRKLDGRLVVADEKPDRAGGAHQQLGEAVLVQRGALLVD